MRRAISSWELDAGHRFARLECGHRQAAGPALPDGGADAEEPGPSSSLDCLRCDARELPEHYAPYRATAEFTPQTLPAGLKRRHGTKRGIWARIVVHAGQVAFVEHAEPAVHATLRAGETGLARPGLEHEVALSPGARFHIEFWGGPER
jgi:tellurite resistance-related uncharacterized protein